MIARAEIRPPVIWLRLARGERIDAGQLVDVQVVIQHPVRTGLERRGDAWTQASEPFYLTEMAVFLGADRVSYFRLTPAVSDNPLITFRLRPPVESVPRVLRNNRGAVRGRTPSGSAEPATGDQEQRAMAIDHARVPEAVGGSGKERRRPPIKQ
jgi:hypothetical protein